MKKILIEAKKRVSLITPLLQLLEEAFPLLDRVLQFRKTIGELPASNEEFKPIDNLLIITIST